MLENDYLKCQKDFFLNIFIQFLVWEERDTKFGNLEIFQFMPLMMHFNIKHKIIMLYNSRVVSAI